MSSSAVDRNGTYSFGLLNSNGDSVLYTSKEGRNHPNWSLRSPVRAHPPLSRTSTASRRAERRRSRSSSPTIRQNGPTSWAWDFQNDGTVDSNVRNPRFTYSAPGRTRFAWWSPMPVARTASSVPATSRSVRGPCRGRTTPHCLPQATSRPAARRPTGDRGPHRRDPGHRRGARRRRAVERRGLALHELLRAVLGSAQGPHATGRRQPRVRAVGSRALLRLLRRRRG